MSCLTGVALRVLGLWNRIEVSFINVSQMDFKGDVTLNLSPDSGRINLIIRRSNMSLFCRRDRLNKDERGSNPLILPRHVLRKSFLNLSILDL